jgi:hypothetical protein
MHVCVCVCVCVFSWLTWFPSHLCNFTKSCYTPHVNHTVERHVARVQDKRNARAPTPKITSKCEILWCDLSFCFMCSWELVCQVDTKAVYHMCMLGDFCLRPLLIDFLFRSPGNDHTIRASFELVQGPVRRRTMSSRGGNGELCHRIGKCAKRNEGKLLKCIACTLYCVLYCRNFKW